MSVSKRVSRFGGLLGGHVTVFVKREETLHWIWMMDDEMGVGR